MESYEEISDDPEGNDMINSILNLLQRLKMHNLKLHNKFVRTVASKELETIEVGTQCDDGEETKPILSSDFVYDSKSGSYYNDAEQCYYFPNYKLYYYLKSGSYYYYDETTKSLQYYSSAMTTSDLTAVIKNTVIPPEYQNKSVSVEHKPQLFNAPSTPLKQEENDDWMTRPIVFESGPKKIIKRKKIFAPCIRLIVTKTDLSKISIGTLFIITRNGGTLGREGQHDIIIPDINVSKFHAKFTCSCRDGEYYYEAIDMGSRNGTYLDGNRLSDSMKESQPFELKHGHIIKVGCTELLCHIHGRNDFCKECEPTFIPDQDLQQKSYNLKEQHKHQYDQIKKKFGLNHNPEFKLPVGYEDKAKIRRTTQGSSHDSEKTEVASTETPINSKNKGFAMMTKLGWKEGESLGKNTNGITAPIDPMQQSDRRGFGCGSNTIALQSDISSINKVEIPKKTLESSQLENDMQ